VATIVWSIIDRRARRHDRLYDAFRVLIRYFLANTMFAYGIVKLFGGQFYAPAPLRLVGSYGDSSPMGLLWTFMGSSKAYVIFSGTGETLGAALILFRRTTTLGALILTAVLTNVVALNLCYDVPVKLYSSMYWSMALFLVAADARRLLSVLIANRATAPRNDALTLPRRWMRSARVVIKLAFVGYMLFAAISMARGSVAFTFAPQTFLDGVWELEGLARDGADVPLLAGNPKTWRRVVFMSDNMTVWRMDATREASWRAAQDEAKGVLSLTALGENGEPVSGKATEKAKEQQYALTVGRVDQDHVVLTGRVDQHGEIVLRLRRVDTAKMLLRTRGFHWISEAPFNR
jgi:hypothetical protein